MPPAPTPSTQTPMQCPGDKWNGRCIAGVAHMAGFGRDMSTLEHAIAIALAESSGRTKIVNSIGCCVGLWQINVKAHPQYTVAQMQDPIQNAKAAFAISNGGRDWTPWEAYTNKTYLIHMFAAKIAARRYYEQNPEGAPAPDTLLPDAIEDPLQDIKSLAQFPAMVVKWISNRDNIFRMMKVVAGVGIVFIGIAVVARPVFKPVRETTMKVIGAAGSAKNPAKSAPKTGS